MGQSETVRFGRFVLDGPLCELRCDDRPVELRRRAMTLLWYLIRHRDRVVPADELHDQVWEDVIVGDAALATTIRTIRKALRDDGHRLIQTVRGHGYRFTGDVEQIGSPSPSPPAPPLAVPRRHGTALDELLVRLHRALEEAEPGGIRIVVVEAVADDSAPHAPWSALASRDARTEHASALPGCAPARNGNTPRSALIPGEGASRTRLRTR